VAKPLPLSFVVEARTTYLGHLRVVKGGPHRKRGRIEDVLSYYAGLGYTVSAQSPRPVRPGQFRLHTTYFTLTRAADQPQELATAERVPPPVERAAPAARPVRAVPTSARSQSRAERHPAGTSDRWILRPGLIAEVMGVDTATVMGWVSEGLLTQEPESGRILVPGRTGRATQISKAAINRALAEPRRKTKPRMPAKRTTDSDPKPRPSGADDLVGRLERLASLHASGALSAPEFEAAKRAILGDQ
jgi:hypothetical protein